ncbi:MAG TPA: hypothetical protein VHT27_12735 [Solirubrobacteraceae bacterium]|nr:hypothetical protein [Solirubrobacteraceae bacterium]
MTEPRPRSEAELIERIRSLDESAPPQLHARVAALIDERARSGRRRPSRLMPALGVRTAVTGSLFATAVAIVVVVLALGGGSAAPDQLHSAAALALRPATLGAPPESAGHRATLDAQVDGVSFPYWEESFGWRASGARVDRLGGRLVRTVFYTDAHGQRIGYAIIGGTPPARISGGVTVRRGGQPYRVLDINGTEAVAWLRAGRLCVVSGRGIDSATLVRLASWRERGTAA